MPTYYFHREAAALPLETTVKSLPDEEGARGEAVRSAEEAFSTWVVRGGALPFGRVILADETGKFLYSLEFLVAEGAAILPRARAG